MRDPDGGYAFPVGELPANPDASGMTLRDYFAIHAPDPSKEEISRVMERERAANPHNEPYHNKVRRRGEQEIRCALRYEFADAMVKQRETPLRIEF